METVEKILKTLKASKAPMSAGQIAEASGIDRKEVDKTMNKLKADGKITSPRRCYWELAK